MGEGMSYQPEMKQQIPLSPEVEALLNEKTKDYVAGKPEIKKETLRPEIKEVKDGKSFRELSGDTKVPQQDLN